MNNSKVWYKSKEIWMTVFPLLNELSKTLGGPSIELTPEFYVAWIGLIGAVRAFLTKTKLTFKQ